MADVSIRESIYGFIKGKTETLVNGSPHSKAMLAKLRRGVGKQAESYPDVWSVLFEGLDEWGLSRGGVLSAAEEAIYTTLTLYAIHQQGKTEQMSRGSDSFGAAIRKLLAPDGSNAQSIKRRFDSIVTAKDYIELSYHARGMIQMLKAKDIPLDYGRFATDLYGFHFPDTKNEIMLRWGEDYYKKIKADKNEKEEQASE